MAEETTTPTPETMTKRSELQPSICDADLAQVKGVTCSKQVLIDVDVRADSIDSQNC